jgi:hypothetical protein
MSKERSNKTKMGFRLEHTLRHLKETEPDLQDWQEFPHVSSSTELDGVLLNGGWLEKDTANTVDGLVLAVFLLDKQCTALRETLNLVLRRDGQRLGDGA